MKNFTAGPYRRHYENILATDGTLIAVVSAECPREQRKPNGLLLAASPALYEALAALTEWGRTHTSPTDPNSPHKLLINAVAALEAVDKEQE